MYTTHFLIIFNPFLHTLYVWIKGFFYWKGGDSREFFQVGLEFYKPKKNFLKEEVYELQGDK